MVLAGLVERSLVELDAFATHLRPRGDGPDVRDDTEVVLEKLLSLETPRHCNAGDEDLCATRILADTVEAALLQEVHTLQDAVDVDVLRLLRLHDRLVVDRHVEDDVLGLLAVHALQTGADYVRDLVAVGRVVADDGRVGGREHRRVAVHVLGAFARQRRAASGRTDEEAARELIGSGPDAVAGALESEHRVEDVDRDHRLTVRRVRRAGGGEGRDGAGLVDAGVDDLALL